MQNDKKSVKPAIVAKPQSPVTARKQYAAPKLTVHGKLERLAAGSGAPIKYY